MGYAPYDIILWNAQTGARQKLLKGHSNWVVSLAFSADGKRLISGAGDSTARIWDMESGKEIGRIRFPGESSYVEGVGLSPKATSPLPWRGECWSWPKCQLRSCPLNPNESDVCDAMRSHFSCCDDSVLLTGVKSKGDAMSETPIHPTEAMGKGDRLDSAVNRELFVKWRTPSFGSANPERMNNPVWEWLVRSKLSAYQATQRLRGPSALKAGPGWCFDRFGQSSTKLPDGRVVLIAGEHEDAYDPDFYIYNDVVVQHPDGSLDIYGYPRDEFPPTDFHSATLVSNRWCSSATWVIPRTAAPTGPQSWFLI